MASLKGARPSGGCHVPQQLALLEKVKGKLVTGMLAAARHGRYPGDMPGNTISSVLLGMQS